MVALVGGVTIDTCQTSLLQLVVCEISDILWTALQQPGCPVLAAWFKAYNPSLPKDGWRAVDAPTSHVKAGSRSLEEAQDR